MKKLNINLKTSIKECITLQNIFSYPNLEKILDDITLEIKKEKL